MTDRARPVSRMAMPSLLLVAVVLAAVAPGCASGEEADEQDPGTTRGSGVRATRTTSVEDPGAPTFELGVPGDSEPVAPPPDSPMAGIRRDCGISAPLSDGSALWVYCDTALVDEQGRMLGFRNSSAARAEPDRPLVMREPADPEGLPFTFLETEPGYPPCRPGEGRFTWPAAAVRVPHPEPGDRVVIYYHNVCVVPGAFEGYDLGVAEFVTDDPAGMASEPIVGRLLEDRLFSRLHDEPPFGQAAVWHEGHVYLYRCDGAPGPCQVARVTPEGVADSTAYEYWTGSGWSQDITDAGPLVMPEPFTGMKPAVEWIPDLGIFVMVDHHRLGSGVVAIRVARRPEGPWSAPADVELPGCTGAYPDICFAAEIHEQLSSEDHLGLTWYDPTFPAGGESPTRFAEVPIQLTGG